MAQYAYQNTLQYSTFIKRALVESLQSAFANHPQPQVSQARVALDFAHDRWKLPGIIIKFYERKLPNAGVGHFEYLPADLTADNPTQFILYYHRMYDGDISFEIYGQSAVDRDLVRDAFIETIAMWDATTAGINFINRFYNDEHATPYGLWNFPVLMWDDMTGYGETTMIAPWKPEDTLVYQVTYRVPIFGEFYSNTPVAPDLLGVVNEVDVYPYIDPAQYPWSPDQTPTTNPDSPTAPGWYRFTGWPVGSEYI